jgi:hypothetical protein
MTHTRHARACAPPLSHGVRHMFLTGLCAYGAVASRLGRCQQLRPYGKLAPSSFSYAKSLRTQECYESAVVSSKNLCETRLPPALHHKVEFAYECRLTHASTWRGMHVHAGLSLQEARLPSTTEERMA